jgi:hypothetical protein
MRTRARTGVAAALAAAAFLAPRAESTWSVVAVDTATGEICMAAVTCLEDLDLSVPLPVIVVGVGGACAQALIDNSGANKVLIWNELHAGIGPQSIVQDVKAIDLNFNYRQYGIVDLAHNPATFTGQFCGIAAKGVAGKSGTLRWAIQGNVLTCQQVVFDAEAAFLAETGDLAQRVMAAMQAARALGGDGRCSCSITFPTSCGCPPPSFEKSGHVGFMITARIGDVDGTCSASGCATGQYYMDLDVIGDSQVTVDPVVELQGLFDAFRASMAGHVDGTTSSAAPEVPRLVADGLASTLMRVTLADIDGIPLSAGGALLGVTPLDPAVATAGAVTDHGDGSYSFPVTAGMSAGTARFSIVADDGTVQATLYPYASVEVDPLAPLHCGFAEVSAAEGPFVPFTLNLGAGYAGAPFILLGSHSGTSPGTAFGGLIVPLNQDDWTDYTLNAPNGALLPGSFALLDANGRATAGLAAPPGAMLPLVGIGFDWAAVVLGDPLAATNADGFAIEL